MIGIFIDLSKAFDTLDHDILLNKLENAGIRGSPLSLIASYLSNRHQYTSIDGIDSDLELVKFGVPQGSVLGPLLFLLYVADMLNCYHGKDCEFVLYADDTNLFIIDKNRELAIQKANIILENINSYMRSNLLHINLNKCCFIHFESKTHNSKNKCKFKTETESKIRINNHIIKEVSETKFLGVIIDKKLSWIPHIEHLRNKLKSSNGIITRIRNFIPKEHYRSIYSALFESHMTYCISVWGGVSKVHMDKLFRLQKHCIRLLFGDHDKFMKKLHTASQLELPQQNLEGELYCKEHTKPLFNENAILVIHNLYKYHTSLEILKIIKKRTPTSILEQFNISQRNNANLIILGPYSNQFLFLGAKLWNSIVKIIIPHNDLLSVKLSIFKNKLKKMLHNNQKMFDKDTWSPQNFLI